MIEVNNLTDVSIDEKYFKKVASVVLKGEDRKDEGLSIVLVDEEAIKDLNKRYRKKSRPTDVLSFHYDFNHRNFSGRHNELGEVVICPGEVNKNAKMFNSDFNKELAKVLIHGILHLLGYDHEGGEAEAKKMREKENHYLKY